MRDREPMDCPDDALGIGSIEAIMSDPAVRDWLIAAPGKVWVWVSYPILIAAAWVVGAFVAWETS